MKGDPNPRDWKAIAERRMLKACTERKKRKIAEAERDQLQAQLDSLHEMLFGIRQEFHRGMSSLKKVDEKLPVNMVK